MKTRLLKEDKLPPKLLVIFSSKISQTINDIGAYNKNNVEAISQWSEYLDGVKRYISNPVIAFDYTDKYARFPNGARYIKDFDYNIGYSIVSNGATNQPFVYIFMLNLKLEEFGLKIPPTKYVLSESQLRNLIREALTKALQ